MSYTAIAALWVKETTPTSAEIAAHNGQWLAHGEVVERIVDEGDGDPWVEYQSSRTVRLSQVKGPWVALKDGRPVPWPLRDAPKVETH